MLAEARAALLNTLEAKLSQFRCAECGAIDRDSFFIGPFPFCPAHVYQGLKCLN